MKYERSGVVLPVVLTIVNQFEEEGLSIEEMILSAAVHGWMEGHLAAPGHRFDTSNIGEMPKPPFPRRSDEAFPKIVRETLRAFQEGEEPAAVAYATALGWKAGRQAGLDCPGCAPKGGTGPAAKALRSGRALVQFHWEGGVL